LKRYFPSIKQYSWVILVALVIALLGGAYLSKTIPSTSSVNSIMLATGSASGTNIPGASSGGSSLDAATNYASEMISRSVMDYIVKNNSEVSKKKYTSDDLLADVVAVPSATAATVTITATTSNPDDSVLLANAVADGFQNYIQTQNQTALNDQRSKLQTQLSADMTQKNKDEQAMQQIANTSDIHYILANTDLQNVNQQINSIQSQIDLLPATVNSNIIVIQHAKSTDVQTTSHKTLIIAAAGAIGILIGTVIMFLMIFLDDRLLGEDRVKEKLGMAYLGGLFAARNIKQNPALAKGAVMHQFADIVVNLRLTGVLPDEWHRPRGAALLITSTQQAEGKTSIAVGVAAAVARGGGSVVVVDGNLQKTTTHLAFGISTIGMGLAGLLLGTGAEPVDSVVVRSHIPGVWVLPGGQKMEDPTLLLGKKFPGILAQLRKKTDLIIIDGPPLLSGSDALLLATMVDGVALVLDSRHDKLKLLLRAKEMLSTLIHTRSGVILNRMPHRKNNSYFASVTPSDSVSEQWVSVSKHPSPDNGNGNGDVSGYDKRGEKVATFNSTVTPMNGIDSPMNGTVPAVPPLVSMNGMSMQPELTAYPPPPNAFANANRNPLTPLFMPRSMPRR
jgi:capsular exopolysaccharide synthesis family protein